MAISFWVGQGLSRTAGRFERHRYLILLRRGTKTGVTPKTIL